MNKAQKRKETPIFSGVLIDGYGDRYTINKHGDIFSKGRLLKPTVSSKGYMVLSLTNNDGSKSTCYLHQLLALNYLDSNYKSNSLVVDHIDRNPLNNRLDNLRLVNKSDNFRNSNHFENRNKGSVYLRGNRYRAVITLYGVTYTKTFDTKKEAED